MKQLHRIVPTLTIAIATLVFINSQQAYAADNCAELVSTKCTECHNLNRVCQKLGKKSEKRWERTIKRMIKRGLKISKDEGNTILNCLADESPEIVKICK